jgi:hypothetical protein
MPKNVGKKKINGTQIPILRKFSLIINSAGFAFKKISLRLKSCHSAQMLFLSEQEFSFFACGVVVK